MAHKPFLGFSLASVPLLLSNPEVMAKPHSDFSRVSYNVTACLLNVMHLVYGEMYLLPSKCHFKPFFSPSENPFLTAF